MSLSEKTTKTTAPAVYTPASQNKLQRRPGEGFFDRQGGSAFFKSPIQAKLSVNTPGDAHEQEADAVADKVMRMPQPATTTIAPSPAREELQKKEEDKKEEDRMQIGSVDAAPLMRRFDEWERDPMLTGEEDGAPLARHGIGRKDEEDNMITGETDPAPLQRREEEEKIQAKGEGVPEVQPFFEQGLQSSKGGGSPLPDGVKQHMESGIGADFSNVRVHTGTQAAQLSSSIQAQAFTHGRDIYFNEGKYNPGTDSGRHLLAHELTHTVQQGAAAQTSQTVQRQPDPDPGVRIGEKPITIWLDADGDISSKELKVVLQSQATGISVTFSHKAGKKTHTVMVMPSNLDLKRGIWAEQAQSTDGIHPFLLPLLGYASAGKTTNSSAYYNLAIIPGGKAGKYGFAAGINKAEDALSKGIQYFDLDVPATYATEKRNETIIEDKSPQKLAGLYKLSFIAGPNYNLEAGLNIIQHPDNNRKVLCYFQTHKLGNDRGIQQSPDAGMSMDIPIPFDQLKIEKLEEHGGYISYRFAPGLQAGFVVAYGMSPIKQSMPDSENANHSFNIYGLNATGGPQGSIPKVRNSFGLADGQWQYGYTKRDVSNFKIESGKNAYEKIAGNKLPENETQALLNEMGQILAVAVSNHITSADVYNEWMSLSLNVAMYYAGTKDAAQAAALKVQMKDFIAHLTAEIGSTGTEHVVAGGMHGSVNSTRNKFTGAEDTYHTTEFSATSTHAAAFEGPTNMAGQGNFSGALGSLRTSYWMYVSDRLVHNTNSNKDKKDQLRSYGFQMEYDGNLRERLQQQKGSLKKVNAFYYPDQGNLTDEGGKVKFVGAATVSIPLDLYYKLDGNEWVLYNYKTLAEPGKLNGFERRRARAAGEEVPPKEMFDELTYDKGLGLGYIHYQTDKGTGGVVRVDHPWTVGDVLMTIGAIIGILALALTGVGLVVEGAAAAAALAGNVAAVTIAAGTVIKLGESYAHGEPIGAGTIASAAFDIAIAVLPAIRLARGLGTLVKAGEDLYIIRHLDVLADAALLKRLSVVANTGAVIVTSGQGAMELQKLSEALDKGLIDESTFYWAVAKYIGMGMLNVVLIRNDVKSLNAEPKMPKEKPVVREEKKNYRSQFNDEFIDTPENLPGSGKPVLERLIWFVKTNRNTVLNTTENQAFEQILQHADDEVRMVINNFEDPNDFVLLMKGYKDNPAACEASMKSVSAFSGKYGWFTYWKNTPDIDKSIETVGKLKQGNKLLNTGDATDRELATLHSFTVNGDVVNQPLRFNPTYMGKHATNELEILKQVLDKLRKTPERSIINERVYSGKTFSEKDFQKFVNGEGALHNYPGFISTSKNESVAEGFIDLTQKWVQDENKVAVIQRIQCKNGVYIDDISDWGKNLGATNHSKSPKAIQIQEEVLLNPGDLKQVGKPIPIIENGVHKTIFGMKAYYVDFVQIVNN